MKRILLSAMLFAAALLLPATARAQLAIVGHFGSSGAYMEAATYAEDGEIVSIVGIHDPDSGVNASITFTKDEWKIFAAIWQRAKAVQSTSFQFVDSYKEDGTSYNSLLTVAAGPGVQFTINDSAGTCVFTLSPNDFATFNSTVGTITSSLSAGVR